MPAASLMLQASWAAFKDKSVAGFYLANPSLPSEHPVIENVDDLRIFQTIVATRISLPLQQLVSHPGNLTRIGKAADAEGFVPYFYAGAGFTFLDRVEVNVRQSSGGPVSFYSRDLFDRTLNLSFAGGLGLEYRVWFFSCDVRAEASWNGTPKTGWKPYTDAAEDLVTFQFQFGVRVSF
jgi:hypothetical protein